MDADDRHHHACRELLEGHVGPLIVPVLTITEVAYLVATLLGAQAEVRFLGDLASGAFLVEPVEPNDWLRIAELVWRYRDLPARDRGRVRRCRRRAARYHRDRDRRSPAFLGRPTGARAGIPAGPVARSSRFTLAPGRGTRR